MLTMSILAFWLMTLLPLLDCWELEFIASSGPVSSWPEPPDWKQKPQMARYLVHYNNWGIISAVSPEFGFVPYGTLQSFCDGPMNNSTGVPYFYMSSLSDTYKSVQYNNTVSLSLSMAEGDYCAKKGWDPEEPVCARITLVGKMKPVSREAEEKFAQHSLFSRHPAMEQWPHDHGWMFYKLSLQQISLLDYYGGASHISLDDYFKATP